MWFINLLLSLALALAPEQAAPEAWDYTTVRADMFAGLAGDAANEQAQPDGESDQCTAGINFVPCRPREEILRDYLEVVETIYAPEAYFGRVLRVGRQLDSRRGTGLKWA